MRAVPLAVVCLLVGVATAAGAEELGGRFRAGLGFLDLVTVSGSLVAADVLEVEVHTGSNPGQVSLGARAGPRLTFGEPPAQPGPASATLSLSLLGGGRLMQIENRPGMVPLPAAALAFEVVAWKGPHTGLALRAVTGVVFASGLGVPFVPDLALTGGIAF